MNGPQILLALQTAQAITGTAAETQAVEAESSNALLRFIGTDAEAEVAQTELDLALERFISTGAQTQRAQTEAGSSSELVIGTVDQSQAPQSEAGLQALVVNLAFGRNEKRPRKRALVVGGFGAGQQAAQWSRAFGRVEDEELMLLLVA